MEEVSPGVSRHARPWPPPWRTPRGPRPA